MPAAVMFSAWCAFRILYLTVAMHLCRDIRLLFAAYPITWFISSVVFLIYYCRSDWARGFEQPTGRGMLHFHR